MVEKNYEKYSQLISNNPEIGEEDIKHMGDFKGVDLENKRVKNFMADKINIELDDGNLQ